MVTFLSGGTGTPKLLDGAGAAFTPEEITVIANTGDDVELGGHLICPDLDTLLFQAGGVLDRSQWWGIRDDTHRTHSALKDIGAAASLPDEPQYLSPDRQTAGREIANWRRFSGSNEFMTIGDRDRAVHITRTSLLDQGKSLSEVTNILTEGFGAPLDILPMSDDPVASLIHTDDGFMHFQEFWVARNGKPPVTNVEFRGSSNATPAPGVLEALSEPVIIGPSNPVTSIGPMLSLPGFAKALSETTVIAVSPFVDDKAFSGPAAKLMEAVGAAPSTQGLTTAYPFVDAFVIDERDGASFSVPTARTDITIQEPGDAGRVIRAIDKLLTHVHSEAK